METLKLKFDFVERIANLKSATSVGGLEKSPIFQRLTQRVVRHGKDIGMPRDSI
jgi:hypothetical protein